MLNQNFTPPNPELSRQETQRRIEALETFLPRIKPAITSLSVTGSMATGQNYAVTEKSDIDMQVTVTHLSASKLIELNIFPAEELQKSVKAYLEGKIGQFSTAINIGGIPHECHFWDEQALINAMEFKTTETKRIRSSNNSPAVDYAFSFDGLQNEYTCPTEKVDRLFISVLPTYRVIDNKYYLSRPVTNWLSLPYIVYGKDILDSHIDNCWKIAIQKLIDESGEVVDLSKNNILNSLPSKFKTSPESKSKILERTKKEILDAGANLM